MTLDAFAMSTLAEHSRLERRDVMRALDMAHLLSDALDMRADPGVWAMVHGAGLIWYRRQLHPFLLGNATVLELTVEHPLRIGELPQMREVVTSLLGGASPPMLDKVMVLPVASGFRQAAPGDPVHGTGSGTIGPLVQWGSGREAFITAGHVAQTVMGPVNDATGATIGTVVWTNDPALSPSPVGDVDAALVEFTPRTARSVVSRTTIVPSGGARLQITSSRSQADLFAACRRVQLGVANAHYADCYLTDQRITNPGDSGGLVECNGDVAGIVIGAFTRRDMTVVQAVGYQVAEIRARSGHMITV